MTEEDDFTPQNSYLHALQARAASEKQTPEEALRAFAEKDKVSRFAALAAEHAEFDAQIAATPQPRFTAAEGLAEFEPPDPYEASLKALREKGAEGDEMTMNIN